jgi:D-alanine-D-alanine ligase
MRTTRVAVLRGGPSEEYEVSLRSGEQVMRALNTSKYQPIDVVITKNGEWLQRGRTRDPHEVLSGVDVVFNALHGAYGEDGTVQRIIERSGVPYTGTDSYRSAIAFHKAITKDHLRHHGVTMAQHMVVGQSALHNTIGMAESIAQLFGATYMVKPVASGSSVGVRHARNVLELSHALTESLKTYENVLVEEFIEGREATVGIVDGFRGVSLYPLPVVEIVTPSGTFFDYNTKYHSTKPGIEKCPSDFSIAEKRELERLAQLVHSTLGLRHYSRSDFIVTNSGIYFLEVNTLPGLTEQSLIPKALNAVGATMNDFVDHLLTQTLHTRRTAVA